MNWQGTAIHLIGIGGTGLSAIARVLLESGCRVSGSDRQLSPLAQALQTAGAQVLIGHRSENVHGAELVIRSSAVPDDNPEVVEARRLGIPVLKRADFLGELMRGRIGIAVAGSHGKTTTTSMIAWMLTALGLDPSYIVGGVPANLGVNAHAGNGPHFVIEADEYDRMFHGLLPQIALVTNVEHDHPDCYPTPEDFYQAFAVFVARLPADGLLLAGVEDAGAARLARQAAAEGRQVIGYGLSGQEYSAAGVQPNVRGGLSFTAQYAGQALAKLELSVPGEHNARNALAALAAAHQLGLDLPAAAQALSEFRGSGRRFEVRGEVHGVTVVDDYAHHPSEIRATLAAARLRYPGRRLWAAWQPHTYSRTRTLFADFVAAFGDADQVLVTEIYPAREQAPAGGYSSRLIVEAMQAAGVRAQVQFAANLEQALESLLTGLQPGDVLLVLSAGDADQLCSQVLKRFCPATEGGGR